MRYRGIWMVVAVLAGLLTAGCDKCGHRLNLVSPSLPQSCGDNADPGRG